MHKVYFTKQSGVVSQLIQHSKPFLEKINKEAGNTLVSLDDESVEKLQGTTAPEFLDGFQSKEDINVLHFGYDGIGSYVCVDADDSYNFVGVKVAATTVTNNQHRFTYEELMEHNLISNVRIMAIVLEE